MGFWLPRPGDARGGEEAEGRAASGEQGRRSLCFHPLPLAWMEKASAIGDLRAPTTPPSGSTGRAWGQGGWHRLQDGPEWL